MISHSSNVLNATLGRLIKCQAEPKDAYFPNQKRQAPPEASPEVSVARSFETLPSGGADKIPATTQVAQLDADRIDFIYPTNALASS